MTVPWRRFALWSALGLVLLAAIGASFLPKTEYADLAAVGEAAMSVTVTDEGRTRVREVYTVSAPVSGRLLRVSQHAGDAVVAGETDIVRLQPIDPSFLDIRTRAQAEAAVKTAEAALDLAKAEVARVRAALQFAERDLERIETLARRGTASPADLDRARLLYRTRLTELGTAEAAVQVKSFEIETARALLIDPSEAAKSDIGARFFVTIRAPVTGEVLRVLQENETVVAAGTPILEIGDASDLEIVVDLISTDAVKVEEGAPARLTGWGGARALEGRVRRVEPSGFTKVSALGVEEQRVNVVLDIVSPPDEWRALGHGYKIDVEIEIWRADRALVVPLGALFREGGGWAAFVVEEGRARRRPVRLGRTNDREAEVLEGLATGDTVVVHPSDRIADGTPVAPRES